MRIFIDAGHNDKNVDTGAVGNGLREQDVTLDIAQLLGKKLAAVGIDVKQSRHNKTDVIGSTLSESLSKRAKMANELKADLFISLHCNAHANVIAKGTEVYAYSTNSKGYPLAKKVCDSICKRLGTTNRGAKTTNYTVLKKTTMLAILVEIAFITNASDAALLKSKKEDFASAICEAVCEHYGIKTKSKKLESAKDIIGELMNGKLKVQISEVDKAVQALEEAKKLNNSLYWILYKIANGEEKND